MTDDEILKEIKAHPTARIILTGGEPSLFIDKDFVDILHRETGLPVAIETNGTHKLPDNIDWITVSPKISMSDTGDANVILTHADELKVVDVNQDLNQYFSLPCVGPETVMLLQPCFVDDETERIKNTRQTIQRVLDNPKWRLSLQTHRIIGVR